ncbi:MAG: hypothetical protein ABSC05_04865 [Candidatus Solibacter sp.]
MIWKIQLARNSAGIESTCRKPGRITTEQANGQKPTRNCSALPQPLLRVRYAPSMIELFSITAAAAPM